MLPTLQIGLANLITALTLFTAQLPTTQTVVPNIPVEVKTQSVEEMIKSELGEQFVKIAECESGLRQFNDDGTMLISKTKDGGLFQINQIHWKEAEKMGIDITTIEGNIAFAKVLKERRGTKDWYMSRACHGA